MDHPSVGTTLSNLAAVYESLGNKEEAITLYDKAINILEMTLGTSHPRTEQVKGNLFALKKRTEGIFSKLKNIKSNNFN